jgi:hypothetical protein
MPVFNKLLSCLFMTCLIFAIGCASVGRDFPVENVSRIETGKSTQADIIRLFGNPWRTGLENGKITYTYGKYHYSVMSGTATSDLIIRFDEKNVVESYSFNTN